MFILLIPTSSTLEPACSSTPTTQSTLYPAFRAETGLYKTTNGGLSWARTDDGIEEYRIVTLMGDPNIPYRVWLGDAAARGAFMSPDGGDSFLFTASLASHYSMIITSIITSGRRPPYPMYMTSWHPFRVDEE